MTRAARAAVGGRLERSPVHLGARVGGSGSIPCQRVGTGGQPHTRHTADGPLLRPTSARKPPATGPPPRASASEMGVGGVRAQCALGVCRRRVRAGPCTPRPHPHARPTPWHARCRTWTCRAVPVPARVQEQGCCCVRGTQVQGWRGEWVGGSRGCAHLHAATANGVARAVLQHKGCAQCTHTHKCLPQAACCVHSLVVGGASVCFLTLTVGGVLVGAPSARTRTHARAYLCTHQRRRVGGRRRAAVAP